MILRVLIICLGVSYSVHAIDYYIPSPDISFRFNQKIINDVFKSFKNTSYEGYYEHNGEICKNPLVSFSIVDSHLESESRAYIQGGASNLSLTTKVEGSGEIQRCVPNTVQVKCNAKSTISGLWNHLPASSNCLLQVLVFPFPPIIEPLDFPLGLPAKPLLSMERKQTIKLSDSPNVSLEFGSFVDNIWKPSESPKEKSIDFSSSVHGAQFKTKKSGEDLTIWKDTNVIVNNLYADKIFYNLTNSRNNFDLNYETLSSFNTNTDFAQIAINPSIIFKQDSNGRKSGLLGRLLPLRIKGNNGDLKYDVVLTGGSIKIGHINDTQEKLIIVGLNVKSTSSGAILENADAHFAFSLPYLKDNIIYTNLESAKLSLGSNIINADICLDIFLKDNIETSILKIAELEKIIDLSLPDCIAVDDDRMKATRLCDDGMQVGRMSKVANNKNPLILLEFHKTIIDIEPDTNSIRITVPYVVTQK